MKKQDRRVKYTMALLKEALIELMEKKHISKISVKELCEKADVNRSTFYAHYADAHELLHQIEQEFLENVGRYLSEQDQSGEFPVSVDKISRILGNISNDSRVLRIMISENSDIAIQRDVMQYFGVVALPYDMNLREDWKEYINLFSIHGSMIIIQKWLQEGMPQPVDDISAFLHQLLLRGTGSFK
jgi:AcrR family transcriptional regulator